MATVIDPYLEEEIAEDSESYKVIAKAIYDEVKMGLAKELPAMIAVAVKEYTVEIVNKRLNNVENDAAMRVGATFDKMLSTRIGSEMESRLEHHLAECDRKAIALQTEYDQKVVQSDSWTKKHIETLEKRYEVGFKQLMELVKSLPTPQVIMPEQATPIVNVSLPESIINVSAPVVNVPEQAAPIVNVAAPVVNVPPPRLTRKDFSYYPSGQPEFVIEREIKEDTTK